MFALRLTVMAAQAAALGGGRRQWLVHTRQPAAAGAADYGKSSSLIIAGKIPPAVLRHHWGSVLSGCLSSPPTCSIHAMEVAELGHKGYVCGGRSVEDNQEIEGAMRGG